MSLAGQVAAAIRGGTRLSRLPAGLRPSGRLVVAVEVDAGVVCVTEGSRYDVTTWYRGPGTGWERLDVTSTTDAADVPALAGRMVRRLG